MPKRRITDEPNNAEVALRNLSARLLQVQDEERRRIARELHDSVGQLVAAISMNLGAVREQSDRLDAKGAKAVAETIVLVEEIEREIRTISHLLHPPLLDEAGLGSAIRWYVDGQEYAAQSFWWSSGKFSRRRPTPKWYVSFEQVSVRRMRSPCWSPGWRPSFPCRRPTSAASCRWPLTN